MQAITILGLALCLLVILLRSMAVAAKQQPQPRRTWGQKFKTAKLLIAALLAWLAISLHLRQLNHSIDHPKAPYEMTLWDRIVETLSK